MSTCTHGYTRISMGNNSDTIQEYNNAATYIHMHVYTIMYLCLYIDMLPRGNHAALREDTYNALSSGYSQEQPFSTHMTGP